MYNQNNNQKKPSRIKYIAAALIFLLITFILIFILLIQQGDPASEKIIRKIVAEQLNKEPNKLTDEDFAKIIELNISNRRLSDIKFLKKFTSLQELTMIDLRIQRTEIPKWMKILDKISIFNFERRISKELRPIKKLYALKTLDLSGTQISDIRPLKRLINLEVLNLNQTLVSDLEPLRELTNLHTLYVENKQVTDLKPLSKLINLQILDISNTQVSNLEPIKEFKKLNDVRILNCLNIKDEQVEDLEKTLPNLNIIYIKKRHIINYIENPSNPKQ